MAPNRGASSELHTAADQLYRALALVHKARRHWPKGLLVGAAAVLLALSFAVMKKRVYVSESVILYRELIDASYISNATIDQERRTNAREVGMRLREILIARPRLSALIKKFKLYPKIAASRGMVEAVEAMRRDINFEVGAGETFHISYRASTPQLAQGVTAAMTTALIAAETSLRREQSSTTLKFLEAETERGQQGLTKAERKLAEFLAAHPEFAQDQGGAGASIRAQQKRASQKPTSSPIPALQRQAARIKARLRNPKDKPLPQARPPSNLVTARENAQEKLREAQGALNDALGRYTQQHPDVVAAKARVEAAKRRAARVKKAIKAALSAQARAAAPKTKSEREALQKQLADVERQIAYYRRVRAAGKEKAKATSSNPANTIVALETEWQRLNRRVKEARERYVRLEERQFKAMLQASSETAAQERGLQIIDPAFVPSKPAGIGRKWVVIGGAAVGGMIALVLMFGLALADDRIYSRIDLDRVKLTELLVEVPSSLQAKEADASRGRRMKRRITRVVKKG